jgi:hypothetical protein
MYYPGIFLKGLMKTAKTSVSIAGVPAKIRNEHFESRYSNPLGANHLDYIPYIK